MNGKPDISLAALTERVTAGSRLIAPGIEAIEGVFPKTFLAIQTRRQGGVSPAPYDSFNLGGHVGDDPWAVHQNRQRLEKCCATISPVWLGQVHGTQVADLDTLAPSSAGRPPPQADASIAGDPGRACAVLTADCLPILVARELHPACAAIHAGWRGLSAGVIEAALSSMLAKNPAPDRWSFWLGPCIGPEAFEVGEDVLRAFAEADPQAILAFRPRAAAPGKYLADLRLLAEQRLLHWFVTHTQALLTAGSESSNAPSQQSRPIRIARSNACTVFEPNDFFSFRRDRETGRMASLIGRQSI